MPPATIAFRLSLSFLRKTFVKRHSWLRAKIVSSAEYVSVRCRRAVELTAQE
jgi:hypothetical protein